MEIKTAAIPEEIPSNRFSKTKVYYSQSNFSERFYNKSVTPVI